MALSSSKKPRRPSHEVWLCPRFHRRPEPADADRGIEAGWKLDRLGRSLHDIIAMLDDLKQRGVRFQSLTEAIDTETPAGRAMWQMIGVLAELERSMNIERTRAGVKAAQRRGVKFGRKAKLSRLQINTARQMIDKGKDRQTVAQLFNVHPKTLYRAMKK